MATRYRAHVGDTAFDLTFDDDGALRLDGTPVDVTFDALGGGRYVLLADGQSVPVVVEPGPRGALRVTLDGQATAVRVQDEHDLLLERFGLKEDAAAGECEVRAPMPGLVLDVRVAVGDTVAADEGLVVLEAMKMENELCAPAAGVVHALHAHPGDAVDKDTLLVELDLATDDEATNDEATDDEDASGPSDDA